uniref:Uncharacterized protein n=1 Tax=Romanomermis culicivorax TaxID=13658 RepID=A0A915JZ96_ROMCU
MSKCSYVYNYFSSETINGTGNDLALIDRALVAEQQLWTKSSITTDLWSSVCCDAYVGVTYHSIKKDWTLYSKVLAVCHFENQHHTAEKIQECLKSIIDEWKIDCVEIVHDNANNMLVLNKKTMLATVLDPRFKNLGFLNQNLRNKMYSNLEMAASEVEAAIQDQCNNKI